jgi:hypothetical protein
VRADSGQAEIPPIALTLTTANTMRCGSALEGELDVWRIVGS